MKNKLTLFSIVLVSIFLIGIVSAKINNYEPIKPDEKITLKQTCASCSYVNVTVSYPNSSLAISNQAMSNSGGGVWTYDFSNTSQLGRYDVLTCGDIDGTHDCINSGSLYFIVNPSGSEEMSSGAGLSLIGSLVIIVLVGIFFFVLSMRIESSAGKFAFLTFASIILLISVFYSMVIVQQNLWGFESLVSGYSTFFTVLKIFTGVAFTALMIFSILVSIRYYKFKRGFLD